MSKIVDIFKEDGTCTICATRSNEEFLCALKTSSAIIFDLNPDIMNIKAKVKKVDESGKLLFVHIDLAKGIGKDESGIGYLKKIGVDGIISTKSSIIKAAREHGLYTVQRFFMVDSRSVISTAEAFKSSQPDMIEVMPGTVVKVIKKIHELTDIPIIAGGLIESSDEVSAALQSGAIAVSTGNMSVWC